MVVSGLTGVVTLEGPRPVTENAGEAGDEATPREICCPPNPSTHHLTGPPHHHDTPSSDVPPTQDGPRRLLTPSTQRCMPCMEVNEVVAERK